MKAHILFIAFLCVAFFARGQGTFVYDQQSSDETSFGGGLANIQTSQPIGQSFTPTLSSVGFIRLNLSDNVFNGLGAILYVNLRENSITGNVLAVSFPVFLPDGFFGATNFFFGIPPTVSPGVPYYFQPEIQSGDSFRVAVYQFNYPGGMAFGNGIPSPSQDLWFREGIVVPEPGVWALLLFGCGLLAWRKRLLP